MKKKLIKVTITLLLSCLIITESVFSVCADKLSINFPYKENSDSTITDSFSQISYTDYIKIHENIAAPNEQIKIGPDQFIQGENTKMETFSGKEAVITADNGFAEYLVRVSQEGYYVVSTEYYPMKGKNGNIVRSLYIDGKLPFDEAREIQFKRVWINESDKIRRDSNGNDIRPSQIEKPMWISVDLTDPAGYYIEPLTVYLSAGEHTLRFESVKEPMAIGTIILHAAKVLPTYAELKKSYEQKGYSVVDNKYIKVQGEDAAFKSNNTLYPTVDRSSAATEPSNPSKQRINTIGGKNWKTPGQWIVWQIPVEKAGLYRISFRAKQNFINGAYCSRVLSVNGEIPCKEAKQIRFDYDWNWQMCTAKAGDEDMLVYLKEGSNEIGLQVTLGDIADLIRQISGMIQDLNAIYQDIYMITGPTPDIYNDYQFHIKIPDSIKKMETISKQLYEIYEQYKKVTKQDGNSVQPILTMQMTLEKLYDNPDQISYTVSRLKNNISALGTWVLNAAEQPLEIDYIILSDTKEDLPSANGKFFNQLLFDVNAFITSFIEDYSIVSGSGDTQKAESNIKIWIGNSITGGRDQAQILKQIVDDDFTPKMGINAEIQLVAMNSLLTSTLAGKGPDIAISLAGSEPMNYAMRNAVIDLSQFNDFDKISKRFKQSALVPLTFNGSVYGLPETQTFFMLFYRKDVLQKLGLSIPQTWNDVITMLPILQKKQLNFGFPQLFGDYIGMGFYTYAMFLFQNGGTFYEKDGISSALKSKEAIDSFAQFSKYYTDYIVPTQYDFVNRFRSGEVPIGIADYTSYNLLSVFAPEISGLWDFAEVPGTLKKDSTIDRSVAGNITACSILADSKNKKGAWEFLKWWTDTETQSSYGLELESTLGSAARYSPANVEAMKMIPWSTKQLNKICSQWEHVKGVEEVPGGYFTPREVDIAYRGVLFDSKDPGEALEDAALAINFEIDSKRNEFGLPLFQKGE